MITVYKYPLPVAPEVVLEMPLGAVILTAQLQEQEGLPGLGGLCLWAVVDTERPLVERRIRVQGTGQELSAELACDLAAGLPVYLGTVQAGYFVWHLFDLGEGSPVTEPPLEEGTSDLATEPDRCQVERDARQGQGSGPTLADCERRGEQEAREDYEQEQRDAAEAEAIRDLRPGPCQVTGPGLEAARARHRREELAGLRAGPLSWQASRANRSWAASQKPRQVDL